ncbi:MAG: hypothetical protein M0Z46_14560 [Actinomycetota bacterium]|jgi:hypothetical protein|nr:hypothetical protein [Actinomycetota bacterium]
MSTYRNQANPPVYPSDADYDAEEALWRSGPLDLARQPCLPGTGALDNLDWDPETTPEGRDRTACVTLGAPDRSDAWLTLAERVVLLAQRAEPPIWGWSVEGFSVPIYLGHVVYRGELFIAPALFEPCTPMHVVVFEDTVVNIFLEKQWHCGAHRLSAVNATAAEEWLVASHNALPSTLI